MMVLLYSEVHIRSEVLFSGPGKIGYCNPFIVTVPSHLESVYSSWVGITGGFGKQFISMMQNI